MTRIESRARRRRPRQVSEAAQTPGITYVESSALVASVLEGDRALLRQLGEFGHFATSMLTAAEASRALVRARAARRIGAATAAAMARSLQAALQRCRLIPVSREILEEVGRTFPVEPVRTLDAIHLASMRVLGAKTYALRVLTRDARIAANARSWGYQVN